MFFFVSENIFSSERFWCIIGIKFFPKTQFIIILNIGMKIVYAHSPVVWIIVHILLPNVNHISEPDTYAILTDFIRYRFHSIQKETDSIIITPLNNDYNIAFVYPSNYYKFSDIINIINFLWRIKYFTEHNQCFQWRTFYQCSFSLVKNICKKFNKNYRYSNYSI